MKKQKEKQTVDLLALPQKERIRLCKELHNLLQQKVLVEKDLHREPKMETQQSCKNREILSKTSDSYLVRIKDNQLWNQHLQLY